MKNVVTGGVVLGVLCGVWTFVMGFTGWYKHPTLLYLFFLVIAIEIGVLAWMLRRTAAEGRRYWGQVRAGAIASLIGGAIIVVSSLLFTTVVFPEYFHELRSMQETLLREAGRSEAEIRAAVAASAEESTPLGEAMSGFMGTAATGLVFSLAFAGFVRAK